MKFYERVISDFGGYEKCKDILSQPNIDFIMNAQGLREHMLEYRRQHNIFEVGDKVVSTLNGDDFWMNIICVIDGFHKSMIITKGGGHVIHHYDFRHATDEEIKAGKRLEVNDGY